MIHFENIWFPFSKDLAFGIVLMIYFFALQCDYMAQTTSKGSLPTLRSKIIESQSQAANHTCYSCLVKGTRLLAPK